MNVVVKYIDNTVYDKGVVICLKKHIRIIIREIAYENWCIHLRGNVLTMIQDHVILTGSLAF